MAVTLNQLTTPPTREELKDLLLASLDVAGFPVTSWQPGSIPILIVEGLVEVLISAWEFVAQFAQGAYGSTAKELTAYPEWLDLWAQDRFQLERTPASSTDGVVLLSDAGGGPHVIPAGGLIVSTEDGRRFISTADVTVPLDSSATVAVRAVETGATYNVPNGAITTLVTSHPSLSVSNPAQSGSTTWVTTAGLDEESNSDLFKRCIAKWSTLSVATPKGYYESVVKAAAPAITKVFVRDENPNGPGTVEIVCATGAGPASGADLALADSAIQTHRSVGGGAVTVVAATAVSVNVTGTCYVTAANKAAAQAAIGAALTAYQATVDIGGTVYASEIVRIVKSQPGVRTFVPTGGVLSDTALGSTQVATLSNGITFVGE